MKAVCIDTGHSTVLREEKNITFSPLDPAITKFLILDQ